MKIQPDPDNNMDVENFNKPADSGQGVFKKFTDDSLAKSILHSMDTLRQAGQLCDCVLRVNILCVFLF